MKLEEWEHHVIKTKHVAYCGETLGMGFHLLDAEHARNCVKQSTYVQPCPDCWAAIQALAPGEKP